MGEKGTGCGQTQKAFHINTGGKGQEQDVSSAGRPQTPGDLCSNPPRGQCAFYRDCLESRFHCGSEGYPLGYGEKFCEKFVAGQEKLSSAGQKWMMDTMQCLQRVLVPDATAPDSKLKLDSDSESVHGTNGSDSESFLKDRRCSALKEKAFDSHSACYLSNGLCSLSGRDWVQIVEIIGVKTLFDSWDAIKETIEAAEGCL
ncbi:hypothetical protein CVT25_001849 [Psilocybe cyanescens]|uniref:Uncharacterized protein n=1 Tax=Psilocybe cyanescens TaxID=93625 RepID=A0A409WQG0_PSICY|nr:hypothetical protein CVT25_001849 [Psilocybe cyanescens]